MPVLRLVLVAAHDEQPRPPVQSAHGLEQGLEPLDGLEPPHVEEQRIGRQLEEALGGGRAHGLEELGVDAARDHRDALRGAP